MHLSIQNPLQTKQIYLADDKSQLSSCLRTSFHEHPEVSLGQVLYMWSYCFFRAA